MRIFVCRWAADGPISIVTAKDKQDAIMQLDEIGDATIPGAILNEVTKPGLLVTVGESTDSDPPILCLTEHRYSGVNWGEDADRLFKLPDEYPEEE